MKTIIFIIFSLILLILSVVFAFAVNNYAFNYQSNNNSFNMTSGCSGNIKFSPTPALPFSVCLQDISNSTISGSCNNYTDGTYGNLDSLYTNNISYNQLINGNSYRIVFRWKRIRYVDMNNSLLNNYNDSNSSTTPNYFNSCFANNGLFSVCGSNIYYGVGSSTYTTAESDCKGVPSGRHQAYFPNSNCLTSEATNRVVTYIATAPTYRSPELFSENGTNATISGCINLYDGYTTSTGSGCSCVDMGQGNAYLGTSCSSGTSNPPHSLCSYAGDTTDYSTFFVFNISNTNVTANFTDKLVSVGNVYVSADNFTTTPNNFSVVKSPTEQFSLNVNVSDNVNDFVNFTIVVAIDNDTYWNISYATSTFISSNGTIYINLTSNATTPDGDYNGNITITRNLDSKTILIPLNLGISTTYGKPKILGFNNYNQIAISNKIYTYSWVVNNTGNYNLTNCSGSIDGTFFGWSFYSFTTNVSTIAGNSTLNFSVIYNNVPNGNYNGYLQIECLATANNLINSLDITNRPYLTLSSSNPPSDVLGGGGSTSTTIIVGGQNITRPFIDSYFLTYLFNDDTSTFWETIVDIKNIGITKCVIPDFVCKINNDGTIVVSRTFKDNSFVYKSFNSTGLLVTGSDSVRFPVRLNVINYGYNVVGIPLIFALILIVITGFIYVRLKQ